MCIYGMWLWKVPKWPWFWAEVAVKAWRNLATLVAGTEPQKNHFSGASIADPDNFDVDPDPTSVKMWFPIWIRPLKKCRSGSCSL
jgi:hypothetical protein